MKIAIVDDDIAFMEKLEDKLYKYVKRDATTIDRYEKIKPELYETDYDIIFLDIMLGDKTSYECGNNLVESKTYKTLVYISNYDHLIFESINGYFYFFIRKDELDQGLSAFFKKYRKKFEKYARNIKIRSFQNDIAIPMHHIIYIASQKNKNKIHICTRYCKYETYQTLYKVSASLNLENFYRLNAQFIINFDHISEVKPDRIIMSNGDEITFTRNSKKPFLDTYSEYQRKFLWD